MSENHQDVRLLLGAYVLGALDRPDVLQVEEHLPGYPACRDEVADLATLPEVLRRRPPTDAATLRPPTPTELLPTLLHQVADQRRRQRNRWALGTTVVASVAALAVGGGVALLTRGPSPTGQQIALSATAGSAFGHVQLTAKPWGSALTVDLSGLPVRGPFVLQTTARDGHQEQAATWAATGTGIVTVVGATSVTPADVTRIIVLGPDGQELAHTTTLPG